MKSLVLYYSLEGNTNFVAEAIANKLGADLRHIEPVKEYPTNFIKYVKGGFQAFFKLNVRLKPLNININDYDKIYIGTPVWAGRVVPPVRSFLKVTQIKDKKIGLFCTYRESAGSVFKQLEDMLKGNKIIDYLEFEDPLKNKDKVTVKIEKLD